MYWLKPSNGLKSVRNKGNCWSRKRPDGTLTRFEQQNRHGRRIVNTNQQNKKQVHRLTASGSAGRQSYRWLARPGRKRYIVSMVGLVVLLIVGFLACYGTQRLPTSYSRQLQVPIDVNDQRGILFERNLVDLSNQIRLGETWGTRLQQDQLNGWLAADLNEKFPEALPDKISNPRVTIFQDRIVLVFRYRWGRLPLVIRTTADVFSTDKPNQIAFCLRSTRTGWIPVPVSLWADHIAEKLSHFDVILEWTENSEHDTVALVTLPAINQFAIESCQLQERAVEISGRSFQSQHADHQRPKSVAGTVDESTAR